MKSEKKLDDVIRREMTEIRDQYGDDRRTELIEDDSATLRWWKTNLSQKTRLFCACEMVSCAA